LITNSILIQFELGKRNGNRGHTANDFDDIKSFFQWFVDISDFSKVQLGILVNFQSTFDDFSDCHRLRNCHAHRLQNYLVEWLALSVLFITCQEP